MMSCMGHTTRLEDLDVVQSSIARPRHEMHFTLKMLKLPSTMYGNITRRSLTNELIEIVSSNKDNSFKKEDCCVVPIKFLTEIKVKTRMNSAKEKWTRIV